MGYCADTVDIDFVIVADKVPAALAAMRAEFSDGYMTLSEGVEDLTSFRYCNENLIDGFRLGAHGDNFLSYTEDVLGTLARFAAEGSYVRLIGEDYSLFGYRVVGGRLREESGDYVWSLDSERSGVSGEGVAR